MVWPLEAAGAFKVADFELSAAAILSISFRPKNREGKRARVDMRRFDISQQLIIKRPLDREEGPVGP